MPSVFEQNAVYLQSGNPRTENNPTMAQPGQLGARFSLQFPTGRNTPATPPRTLRFQFVRLDPAALASLAGGPAYWVDRVNYTVGGVGGTTLNQVAGVFGNAVTPGNYTCIQIDGPCPVRVSDANAAAAVAGADMVVGGASNVGVLVAAGTAPSTYALGTIASPKVTDTTGGTGNHKVVVDLNLPEVL